MTFTIEYRTTAGDAALLKPTVQPMDDELRSTSMRPGVFRLTSTDRTTTTASWVKKGLRARGRAYKFFVQFNPAMPAFGEPIAKLVVYRFTHVVDAATRLHDAEARWARRRIGGCLVDTGAKTLAGDGPPR
jgi:hypothetical protein